MSFLQDMELRKKWLNSVKKGRINLKKRRIAYKIDNILKIDEK